MLNGIMCGRQLLKLTLVSGKALYSQPFLFALYIDDLSKLGSSFKGCCMILYADDI